MLRNFKILTQTFVLKKACLKQINIAKYVSTSAMQGPDQIVTSDTDVTTSADGYVKLRLGPKDDPSGLPPISVPSLLMKAAREAPDIPALTIKRDGKWVKWTYKEYHQEVRTVAKAFIALGLERHKSVAILGSNSPEWFISDLAAVFAGSIAAGMYPTNSPEMCKYTSNHCKANIIVVEDEEQLEKIMKIKSELTDLKAIVQYTGKPTQEGVLSWQDLLDKGQSGDDAVLDLRLKEMAINQCCHLVYTSGTTGPPKAVMLSHDNITFTAKILNIVHKYRDMGQERNVSYLPLSHVAGNMLDIFVVMTCRGTTYFADKNALKVSLIFTLKEALPTLFLGVPRVWEKIEESMREVGKANSSGLKKQISQWAKQTGLAHNMSIMNGEKASMLKYKLADKLVFQKVKTALGLNKCRNFFVGAAPMSVETFEYYMSLDIKLYEVYGMSECTGPHVVSGDEAQKLGSVGKTMPGCLTRLATNEDKDCTPGEILMKGRNVMMGYLGSPDKTAETITESGWLRSGDLGHGDESGFYRITGRAKEILITSGGENIAPTPIEEAIKKQLPCVSNALLIGDKRKYLTCLLTLKTEVNPETLEPLPQLSAPTLEWCNNIGSKAKTITDILDDQANVIVMKAIQDGIDRVNRESVSNAQTVQKWVILPKDLSVPGGELGPTFKTKRHFVLQKYAQMVDDLYK